MCSGLHSATVTTFSTGTPLTTVALASSLLYSHPDVSICYPAVRVRQLQRGPLTWSYTPTWKNITTRSPAALPYPHPTLAIPS